MAEKELVGRMVDGPDKWDLMIALFQGDLVSAPIVHFILQDQQEVKHEINVKVDGITRMGGEHHWRVIATPLDYKIGGELWIDYDVLRRNGLVFLRHK